MLVWAVAATNVNPAVLFSPDSEVKTLGPAIVQLAGGDAQRGLRRLCLALAAGCTNLAAIAIAYATRAVPRDGGRSHDRASRPDRREAYSPVAAASPRPGRAHP